MYPGLRFIQFMIMFVLESLSLILFPFLGFWITLAIRFVEKFLEKVNIERITTLILAIGHTQLTGDDLS